MKKSKTLIIASALLLGAGGMAVSNSASAYYEGDRVLRSLNLLLGGYDTPERVIVYRDIDRPRYRHKHWRRHHDRHDRGYHRGHHRDRHWDRGFKDRHHH